MGFFKAVIRRPVTIFMIILCIILFGVMAVLNMPVTLLPNMNMPMLTVVTAYPGASPDDVESDVTAVLEKEFKTVSGITDVMTYSMDNVSAILLQFEFGSDLSELKDTVKSKLELIRLPSGCETPVIQNIDLNAKPVAKLAVKTSDEANIERLSAELEGIKGVTKVNAAGTKTEKIEITPKPLHFTLGGLTVPIPTESLTLAIVQAVSSGSYDIPLGSVTEDGKVVTVRNLSEITSREELLLLPVSVPIAIPGQADKIYLLGDVADVSDPQTVYPEGKATLNGEECVMLSVYKLQDGNTANIVGSVKDKISGYEGVTLVDDQSEYITDSISSVWSSLIIGAILAFLIIVLFLANVKSSLIISLSMPLSVLLAIICIYALGVTLNMVSLGGLALGIGMLVDNSIVVIESITRRREAGETPKNAAASGTKSVAGAILASTLTTIAVFLPIMFVKGMTEEIFRDLSLSVMFSLIFSLVVALTIIPSMYAKFGGKERRRRSKTEDEAKPQTSVKKPLAAVADPEALHSEREIEQILAEREAASEKRGVMYRVEEGYKKVLRGALGKRWLVLTLSVVLFGASVGLLFTTGTEFLPSMERGVVEIGVTADNPTLENTQKLTEQVAKLVSENVADVDYVTSSIDSGSILSLGTEGLVSVRLKPGAKRSAEVADDIRKLVSSFKNATINPYPVDGIVQEIVGGASGSVSISINGESEEVLEEIGRKIVARAAKIEGVASVKDTLSGKQKQYQIAIDQTELARLSKERGLGNTVTYDLVVKTLRVGLAGFDAQATLDGQKTGLSVSFSKDRIGNKTQLEAMTIIPLTPKFDASGNLTGTYPAVTLKQILKEVNGVRAITEAEVSSVVKKLNGLRTLHISANVYKTDSGSVSSELSKIASEILKDYEGYTFSESGVSKYLGEAFSGLVVALVISIFLVFAIMAAQFESLKKPFIIMFSVPFAFTGGFLALAMTATTLNVVSFIGVIMLIGVIVNNAIVMIDKIEQLKQSGMDEYEAVLAGTASRLRPILMSTLTTVLALIPIAIGIGDGSELLQPMGIVVIGGMALGTLVTLLLIPTIYTLIAKVRIRKSQGKSNPEQPEAEVSVNALPEPETKEEL